MLANLKKVVTMVLEHAAKEAARKERYRRDDDSYDAAYEQRYQRDSDEADYDHFTSDDKHTHTFKTQRRTTGAFGDFEVEDGDENVREHRLRHSIERIGHTDDTSHDDYREQKQQQETERGSATLRPLIVRSQGSPGRKLFMVIAILAIIAALALLGFDSEGIVNQLLGI